MQRPMVSKPDIFTKPVSHRGDTVMFLGVLGVILGWFLIIAMISSTVGVGFALAGLIAVLFGFVGKHAGSLWRRLFR